MNYYPFTEETQKNFRIIQVTNGHYGWRNLWGKRNFHTGIDFAPTKNINGDIELIATADGVCECLKDNHGGLYTYIRADNGQAHMGVHHKKFLVKHKTRVKIGQPIALMGKTGFGSGIHIHYELRKQHWNSATHFNPNPLTFINKKMPTFEDFAEWNKLIGDKNLTSETVILEDDNKPSKLVNKLDSLTEDQKQVLINLYEFVHSIPESVRNTKWMDTVTSRMVLYLHKSTKF